MISASFSLVIVSYLNKGLSKRAVDPFFQGSPPEYRRWLEVSCWMDLKVVSFGEYTSSLRAIPSKLEFYSRVSLFDGRLGVVLRFAVR